MAEEPVAGGSGRWAPAVTAVAMLALAVGVLTYRGPGQPVIRGMGGDVLVVIFLVACLAVVPVGRPWHRILGVGVFAVAVECLQLLDLVGPDSPFIAHLILGSTFDPVDLMAYAMGLVGAMGCESLWRRAGLGVR